MSSIFTINGAAYLNPGVFSYVIQVVAMLVMVIAGGAAIVIYWKKIKLLFKKSKPRPKDVVCTSHRRA